MLDIFYFHPDHLGSSSYITNLAGTVSQHMEYLPFGETLVDEHLNSRNSPFKYNGKEFDEETGNYYYGARYYDPKWSIFVSVDPLAEQTMDSYGYCYNNPINLVDLDGRSAKETDPPIYIMGFKYKKYKRSPGDNHLVNVVYKSIENIKDNAIRFYGHGNTNFMSLQDKNINEDGLYIKTSTQLEHLMKLKGGAEKWKNMKQSGDLFLMQATMMPERGIMQHFSNEGDLKKIIFVGTSEYVYPSKDFTLGRHFSGQNAEEGGRWNIYQNGELIGTREWNWVPTEIDL